jgi:HK97 family phage portal protein
MLNFIERLAGRTRGAKGAAHARPPLFAVGFTGAAHWSPRDYAAFASEGYRQNPVAFRSVRMIAEAAASVPLLLYAGGREIESHPLLSLLAHPNAACDGTSLLETWYSHLLIAGNAFLEAVELDGAPAALYTLRPDRMRVVEGDRGWPSGFVYELGQTRITYDQSAEHPPILHLALFHPTNDHFGMSALEPAAAAIDIHNASSAWSKALLDNAARPSGALVYRSEGVGRLPEEDFKRLKAELEESFSGAANAGRPLLLEGGLDWKPLSLSPQDMDFLNAKNASAREIALALGVPPMLLGIPGDNTYANYREANLVFWRQTVIPLVAKTARALTLWLAHRFERALRLEPDLDAVPALSLERETLWRRISDATFLTEAEKREAVGYSAEPAIDRHPGRDATRSGASQIRDPVSAPQRFALQRARDDGTPRRVRDDGGN